MGLEPGEQYVRLYDLTCAMGFPNPHVSVTILGLVAVIFWVPFWGPILGDFLNILMLPVEVRGFWHWIDYLVAEAKASGKEPLFLNLDETSISQWWSQPKGCVVSRKRWRDGVPPKAGVPANRRRGAVTLCALITHKTDVQPFLPQLVLGNKRILPPSFCAEVSAGPVKFWSEASGWMTHAVLLRYLSLLTEVLDGLPQYRPVLIMDCAPAHMSAEILAFARDNGSLCQVVVLVMSNRSM